MCRTCGCSDDAQPLLTDLQSGRTTPLTASSAHSHHHHPHDHQHQNHVHTHEAAIHLGTALLEAPSSGRTIRLEQNVLAKNDSLAERNRLRLSELGITALNLISSPGAGKTTLLVRTIKDLGGELPISVIEGDQATLNDAQRIQAAGCKVVQINTGAGCHLEADMTARGLEQLEPAASSLVFIENVGNLVCPSLFDLGERAKVVVASVTEGDDKPLKYPHAFRAAKLVVLNKIDLLPHVEFEVEKFGEYVRRVNPSLRIVTVSATRGDGLSEWYDWLRGERTSLKWL